MEEQDKKLEVLSPQIEIACRTRDYWANYPQTIFTYDPVARQFWMEWRGEQVKIPSLKRGNFVHGYARVVKGELVLDRTFWGPIVRVRIAGAPKVRYSLLEFSNVDFKASGDRDTDEISVSKKPQVTNNDHLAKEGGNIPQPGENVK